MRKMTMTKDTDRRTNEEFVSDLMNYSRFGGLSQSFVIEALRSYSTAVADQPIKEYGEGEMPLLDPTAWHGLACEIRDKVAAKYSN